MMHFNLPFSKADLCSLRAGDEVLISGTVYTARDQAHKRLCAAIDAGEPLKVDLRGAVLYYTGPSPARPGRICGSAGPTTSSRMDKFTPKLLRATGLFAMIGKGSRNDEVIQAMRETGSVYFAAAGGAGAYLAKCITGVKIICYEDLGTEAIRELTVKDFPLITAIDSYGGSLYS